MFVLLNWIINCFMYIILVNIQHIAGYANNNDLTSSLFLEVKKGNTLCWMVNKVTITNEFDSHFFFCPK